MHTERIAVLVVIKYYVCVSIQFCEIFTTILVACLQYYNNYKNSATYIVF